MVAYNNGYESGMGYGNAMAVTTVAPAPPRESAIAKQCALLDNRVSAIHDTVSMLEQRLSPVTTPEGPSTTDQANEVKSPVPLALALAATNNRLLVAYERLNSLLNRIEL